MSRRTRRANKKFWRKVMQLTLVYLAIIPLVFFILDQDDFNKFLRREPFWFPVQIMSVAFAIGLVIAYWGRRDPELQKW
jgi:hypothetical protein